MARKPATPAILKGIILIAMWAPLPPRRWTAAGPLTIRARGCSTPAASSLSPPHASSRASSRHGSRRRRAATDRHRRIPPPSSSTPPPPSSAAATFPARLCSSLLLRDDRSLFIFGILPPHTPVMPITCLDTSCPGDDRTITL